VSQDSFKQILNECNKLDGTIITDVIKNLIHKLKDQEKSTLLEQLASDVSPEVKATLVKRLLADGGLQVTFGQSHVNVTNFYNIQSASTEQLSDIVLAIADIIRKS
jgi:hypothetical protein